MVSFSVASMFFHEYPVGEIFSFASRAGLDALEFWMETPHFWLRGLPAGELAECRKNNPGIATLTVHAPVLDLNPCSVNPEVAEISVEYAIRSVAIAETAGAGVITVHPGRRTAKRPPGPADFERFDRYITRLSQAAQKTPVHISIENMEPSVNGLLCTPDRVRSLLDDESWLYFTLDVAHATAASADEPLRYINLCHDRLANVHISTISLPRVHLPLDRSPSIARVLSALRDVRYDGSLTLEIEDLNMPRPFSADEKIALLQKDCSFMRECMQQGAGFIKFSPEYNL